MCCRAHEFEADEIALAVMMRARIPQQELGSYFVSTLARSAAEKQHIRALIKARKQEQADHALLKLTHTGGTDRLDRRAWEQRVQAWRKLAEQVAAEVAAGVDAKPASRPEIPVGGVTSLPLSAVAGICPEGALDALLSALTNTQPPVEVRLQRLQHAMQRVDMLLRYTAPPLPVGGSYSDTVSVAERVAQRLQAAAGPAGQQK